MNIVFYFFTVVQIKVAKEIFLLDSSKISLNAARCFTKTCTIVLDDQQTDRQAIKQTNKQTNKQTRQI